jgi:hypothetical protein
VRGKLVRRFSLVSVVAALALAASASPATASVTIGQLAPSPVPTGFCNGGLDRIQVRVASGTGYTVPGDGTIVSWSTNAGPNTGQEMTMKVFRKVAEPNTYSVVGHDGPRSLNQSTLNTFATSIPVKAGDLLGMHSLAPGGNPTATYCDYLTPGSTEIFQAGDLADGASAPITNTTTGDEQLNISAVLIPSNSFSFGATRRNKKKGTATLNLNLPNPGDLTGSGNGVTAASAGSAVISKAVGAGAAQLLIKAKGNKKRTLNATGKVKLNVAVTYTPTGGDPRTQSVRVKLKKGH